MLPLRILALFDARRHLGRVLDRVRYGEIVLLTKNGTAVAYLIPVQSPPGSPAEPEIQQLLEILRARVEAKHVYPFPPQGKGGTDASR